MSETPTELETVERLVRDALDDMKAENPVVLDVRGRTAITDLMVFASGTSRRHVKSIAERLQETAKAGGFPPAGVEGADQADWVLVDLGYAVVHIMLPDVRDFYRLENIWGVDEDDDDATGSGHGSG